MPHPESIIELAIDEAVRSLPSYLRSALITGIEFELPNPSSPNGYSDEERAKLAIALRIAVRLEDDEYVARTI